jgi:hypothetical protein
MFTSQQKLSIEAFKQLAVRQERGQTCITYYFADKSFVEITKYNDVHRYLPNGWRI